MTTSDVNAFKGQFKNAIVGWTGKLIDQMLPNRVTARTLFKNAVGNMVTKFDGKINQAVDTVFLMFGDASGNIDTDSTIDLLCGMLNEMKPTQYSLGIADVVVGQGEIKIDFPHSIFSDFIVGDLSGVKLTTSDLEELKNYLS